MNANIAVNTRSLASGKMTGIQRYTSQILSFWEPDIDRIAPLQMPDGVRGHVWEQLTLPCKLQGRLLWSPGNTGPLAVQRQVVTIHDMATLDHPEWFEQKFAAYYRCLLSALTRRVRAVITVSEYSRYRIAAHTGIPYSKIRVIPLAAGSHFQPTSDLQQEALRVKFALPQRFVLCVGSLEPRKNLQRLFAAWEAWKDRPQHLYLLVVGSPNKVFQSVGFKHLPGGVRLLGHMDDHDLPTLYGAAEAFLYPSLYEGFGLPPLEAMACNTAVITSNTTSLPEVVGGAALLIDPYSQASILRALRSVVHDQPLRDELRRSGLEHVKKFSWAHSAKETWEMLITTNDNE